MTQRTCPSEDIRKEALANNPALMAKFVENESKTAKFIDDLQMGRGSADGNKSEFL